MSWFSDRTREPFDRDETESRPAGARRPARGLDPAADPDDDGVCWSPLARFSHVAEAGYFADELTAGLEAPVLVRSEQSFDSLRHDWQTRFVLLVPQSVRDQAGRALQRLIDEGELDEPGFQAPSSDGNDQPPRVDVPRQDVRLDAFDAAGDAGRIHWGPIVLTLTAGSAVLCGLRWMQDAPHNPAPRPAGGEAGLLDVLTRSSKPWVQPMGNGAGRRELRFDRRRGVAIVSEDADGDGIPEREVRVPLERRP